MSECMRLFGRDINRTSVELEAVLLQLQLGEIPTCGLSERVVCGVCSVCRAGRTCGARLCLLAQLPGLVLAAPVSCMNEEKYSFMKDLVFCAVI
jgi:hypothetical protein